MKISLNNTQIKYIAVSSMTIDHTAIILQHHIPDNTYEIMRNIGRIAYPIFIYMLVEGFFKTHDRKKYLTRLALFACLAEPACDLFRSQKLLEFTKQNVIFGLLLGVIAMLLLDTDTISGIFFACTIPFLALLGNVEYGGFGVLTICTMYYVAKENKGNICQASLPQLVLGFLPLMIYSINCPSELYFLIAIPILLCYNGKKGNSSRYFFYLYYPLHKLALAYISYICFR